MWVQMILLALVPFAAVTGIVCFLLLQTSPLDEFWKPVIEPGSPVLISVGSVMALLNPQPATSGNPNVGDHPLYFRSRCSRGYDRNFNSSACTCQPQQGKQHSIVRGDDIF